MWKKKNKITTSPEHKNLAKEIATLNTNIQKQLSFRRGFLFSLVSGVGYAIGASIVAGIIIAILSRTIHSLEDIPGLKDFFR